MPTSTGSLERGGSGGGPASGRRLPSPRGPDYRWVVLGATVLALMVSAGLRQAVGDFLPAWQGSFHADLAAVSAAAAVALLVYGLCQPLVGRLLDRFGVRAVLTAGLLVIGGGLLLTSRSGSPAALTAFYGVVVAAGYAGVAQLTATTAVAEWFSSGRGLALGICNAGNSVGMMVFGPVGLFLVSGYGWRSAEVILAGVAVVVAAPLAWVFVRPAPGEGGTRSARRGVPLSAVVRDRSFWLLALPFFICGYTTNGLIGTHFVKFLDDDGLQTTVIAGALAVMGAANAVGALASGFLADRWGRARLLAWIYGSRGISLLLMLLTSNPLLITLLSGYYGLVDFATVPPTASLTADIFGRRGLGTAFAWIALAHQVGGATSSLVAGLLVDWTGSYVPVFILSALLLGVAVWLSGALRSREPVVGAARAAAMAPAGR